MISLRPPAPIILTAALAGALGYWAGLSTPPVWRAAPGIFPKNVNLESASPAIRSGKGASAGGSYPISSELRLLLGDSPVPDAAIHSKMMQVLQEPDAVRRTAAVTLLLEKMNAANADAFREAFLECTAKSGRRHDNEWGMMLRQYGKVLGAEGMTRLKDVPQDAQKVLEGWAIANPTAVQSWLSRDHPDYKSLHMTMLSGIALVDPEMAFALVLSNPSEPIEPGWIINNGILGSGTDGVTIALQKALDSALPEAVDSQAFRDIFGNLTGAVFRQKWEARESIKMLPWLESLKGQPFVTGDMIGHGAMDAILQGNLIPTLDWLDRMEGPAARPAVTDGFLQGILGNSDLLAEANAASLERVIARFPPNSPALAKLAQAVAGKNPAFAARLQGARHSTP